MKKIVFIGGGSIQWTPGLVNDIALTRSLEDSAVTLYDINIEALRSMVPLCRNIAQQQGSQVNVIGEIDREKALKDADFVVLCVGIGGLKAMQNDLTIPEKYAVYHSVGDTVGPGGLARGLRHIPFAVELALEMQKHCPQAWLLNLTNPMTTICRAVTKSTAIRTIGLCHEVTGIREHLSGLFKVPAESILMEVAGINHLPVITRLSIQGQDGFTMLRDWLSKHDIFDFEQNQEMETVFEVFQDMQAVKLTIFQQTGVYIAAGDRHVAEFFPGFLIEENQYGLRYGIRLTTAEHREEMLAYRKATLEDFTAPETPSQEQLAPLMAALAGHQPGIFIVNIPNQGQIDNLPREAVVECLAYASEAGISPIAVGPLPSAAHAIVAPHVDRQEMIVEAALTNQLQLAKKALASDPLVRDPQIVEPLFNDLLAANLAVQENTSQRKTSWWQRRRMQREIAAINAKTIESSEKSTSVESGQAEYTIERTPIGVLVKDEEVMKMLETHYPDIANHPQLSMVTNMTLKSASRLAPRVLTKDLLAKIEAGLAEINANRR